MVTLQTAENALKAVYLGVVSNQIDTQTNPFFTRINQTTANIWGKYIIKNPSWQTKYEDNPQFKQELSSMFASIEISDKAIRCAQNSAGAFINLLNAEFEYMVKSTQIELNKALFAKSNCFNFLGLKDLFDKDQKTLYGLEKKKYKELQAISLKEKEITPYRLMEIIDTYNDEVNMIICGNKIFRDFKQDLLNHNQQIEIISLDGGFKAISFNGIPMLANKEIADNELYLLNTNDFEFNQLCNWQWLENESGKVIRQVVNKPMYNATLVKYGDLICDNPSKQIKITLI